MNDGGTGFAALRIDDPLVAWQPAGGWSRSMRTPAIGQRPSRGCGEAGAPCLTRLRKSSPLRRECRHRDEVGSGAGSEGVGASMGAGHLTSAGIERLHAAAEQHVGDTRVPGLVALVARGDQVHVEALGSLTIDGRAVARDAIFRIASTTKPITAAATLAVVAEGLIDLEEPVERLLPE